MLRLKQMMLRCKTAWGISTQRSAYRSCNDERREEMDAASSSARLLRTTLGNIKTEKSALTAHQSFPLAWLAACIQLADVFFLMLSGWFASRVCDVIGFNGDAGERILATTLATIAAIFVMRQAGAYRQARLLHLPTRSILIAGGVLAGALAATLCLGLLPETGHAALAWPAVWSVFAFGQCVAAAAGSAVVCQSWHDAGSLNRRVAVVGVTPLAQAFIDRARNQAHGVSVIGLYEDRDWEDGIWPRQAVSGLTSLGCLTELVTHSRRERIDAIVLALPLSDVERIVRASAILRSVPSDIYVTTGIDAPTARAGRGDSIGGYSAVRIATRPLDDWQLLQKAVLDRCLAAVLLIAALPLLGLIALAIVLDSPGPVLFRQPRHGFNGTMFSVFKFRTMFHDMADLKADRQTRRGDPRITRVGRLLRRFSLDEVPQLFNVLRGEMSLVGPRPHAPNTKAGDMLFHEAVADYALRHRVKPGITGWAQVNGWRGETRTQYQIEQRVAYDLHYIDNWSLLFDFRILVLTLVREINSRIAF